MKRGATLKKRIVISAINITQLGPLAILRDVLLVGDQESSAMTFEAYLRKMPDVGTDADFSRIEGSIRDVNLAD